MKILIVAFLDLLGFSALLQTNVEVALDNMNSFNNIIKTRFIDDKCHPIEEYKNNYPNDIYLQNFVKKSSVTAFNQMISFSDSLVLGGEDCNLFIMQLADFVATAYINYSEPFKKPFAEINNVEADKVASVNKDGSIRYHKAFPLLFRGGISVGKDINFFNQHHIYNNKLEQTSLNVFGLTYLNAVKLEGIGKGPRLFCDKSVVDATDDEIKKYIKLVDIENGIYEIIWTIEGCEATGCNSNDKWQNVIDRIQDKMLPSAINFYHYYKNDEILESQYKDLLYLVCEGIIKYAKDNCNQEDDAINYINKVLEKNQIQLIDKSLMEGFLR